jgi:dihydrofolate reductase
MAKLIYSAIASLDGYIEDEQGKFDWAEPDEEVHAFVNELQRPVGTYLFGRRMYETMAVWETLDVSGEPTVLREFAELWKGADKIVYSTTLESVSTARSRIERQFDPEAVRQLKAVSAGDLAVAGPALASAAFAANLVDELHLFLVPVVVGGGKRALPDHVRLPLEFVEQRSFSSGVVYLRYSSAIERPSELNR